MKRVVILALVVVLIMAAIVATAAYAAPRVFAHTVVGTNGNDDLIAPFGAFGKQDTAYGLDGRMTSSGISAMTSCTGVSVMTA